MFILSLEYNYSCTCTYINAFNETKYKNTHTNDLIVLDQCHGHNMALLLYWWNIYIESMTVTIDEVCVIPTGPKEAT